MQKKRMPLFSLPILIEKEKPLRNISKTCLVQIQLHKRRDKIQNLRGLCFMKLQTKLSTKLCSIQDQSMKLWLMRRLHDGCWIDLSDINFHLYYGRKYAEDCPLGECNP